MKKLSSLKIVQLSVFTVLTLACIYFLTQDEVKQFVFSSGPATVLFALIWVLLVLVYLFLLLDFDYLKSSKQSYHGLYEAAYADSVSGLPNRFSCDVLIEKYVDSKLPELIGCMMIDLTNLSDVNSSYGHAQGNELLKQFSIILTSSAHSTGFVGRNGGNKFLALFEECGPEKLNHFLDDVTRKVEEHNCRLNAAPLKFRAGSALNSEEHLDSITDLISLANQRIYQNTDRR